MITRAVKPQPRRAWLRWSAIGLSVVVGLVLSGIVGLMLWDGGIENGPRREIAPGIEIDLKTTMTRRGPVEYDLSGPVGPVVLSVHAGLGGADQGRLLADWLRQSGFRILSPSRPGYLGTPLAVGRSNEEQADLLLALMDRLGIEQVGMLAVSAGAPVAYTFAAQHPDRVWGLVSIGGTTQPWSMGEASPLQTAFMNTVGQKLVRFTGLAFPRALILGTLDETGLFTDKEKEERADAILADSASRTFFDALVSTTLPYSSRVSGTRNDATQSQHPPPLARIKVPVLVVHGVLDGDVPFTDGVEAAAAIPGAEHLWLPEEDHLGFWLTATEAPARNTVARFLVQHRPYGHRR